MQCQQMKSKLELYIDNELGDQERSEVEEHLSRCAVCAKELEVLKSINSVGKIDVSPDPQSRYWKNLTQSIRDKIDEIEEEPFKRVNVLEKLKDIVWPKKISYRLVGLAATAVIIFFIIHISFFQNGKLKMALEIDEKDALTIPDRKNVPLEPQSKDSLPNDLPLSETEQKITPKSSTSIGREIRQPSVLPKKSKKREIPIDYKIEEDISADLTQISSVPESIQADGQLEEIKGDKFGLSSQGSGLQGQNFQGKYFSIKPVRVSEDSGVVNYENIIQTIQKVTKPAEKISIWESYLSTNPSPEYLKKAKYEQAILYYELAIEKITESSIKEALKFHNDNIELLTSGEHKENVLKQIQELNILLKKITEN